MTQKSSGYIKENFVFNYSMLIFDSIGFGSAFALLVPFSYAPDIAFDISGAWYAAPSTIIIFYFLNILGQFISSSTKKLPILWLISKRVTQIPIFSESISYCAISQIVKKGVIDSGIELTIFD